MLRYLLGKQSWSPYSSEPVEFAELNFDFHPKAVRGYLQQAGFDIEKQLAVSHFRVEMLKRHIPTRWLAGLDSLLQWTGTFLQVSPSVFSRCRAPEDKPTVDAGVLFQCPSCGTALPDSKENLTCLGCGKRWEYRDGIYDFRISPPAGD
jgi:hypothetical protein